MPQVTVQDKIKKYANEMNISGLSMKFLTSLIKNSQNAIIANYSALGRYYIDSIFNCNQSEYAKSFRELSDARMISYNTLQDKMIIQVLLPHHINNLLYGLLNPKHKGNYFREPIKQQNEIMDILTSGKLGEIIKTFINPNHNVPSTEPKYKENSFKVPESIMPYFTGKPLTDEERNALLLYNPDLIVLEEKRRNMPKHSILAYCACLTFMNNGIIDDCTENSLLQNVMNEFGKDTFCVQTWYNSIDKLIELKLIEKFYDERKSSSSIRIIGINQSSERYVIVPGTVFEKDFMKLETAGVKMFFDIIFGLNNGEERKEDGTFKIIGHEKTHFLKVAKLDTEKKENHEKFKNKLLQYKKRYPGELRIAIFGDAARNNFQHKNETPEFKALAKYFHFFYTSGTAVMVKIRKEYYISKESGKNQKQLLMSSKCKRKKLTIENLLKKYGIEYQQQDAIDLITVLRGVNKKTMSHVVSILAQRVRLSTEYGWDKIINLPAYLRKVLKEYQQQLI